MNKRKSIIGGGVAILLLVAAAWGFGFIGETDPAIAQLQQLGEQMSGKNLPDAQRDQLRDDFRQQIRSLSDDQRRAFFDANRDQWQARSEQRMSEFFAMSKADQQKRLDEIINRMNQPRDTQRQTAAGQNRGGQDRGAGGNNNGGRGGRGGMTEGQREERSKRRLDQTSPKMRAQFSEFRRRLDERAQQRGVKINDPPWGGGFGGGRRGV